MLYSDAPCSTEASGSDCKESAYLSETSAGEYLDVLCSTASGSGCIDSLYIFETSDSIDTDALSSTKGKSPDAPSSTEASGSEDLDSLYIFEASKSIDTDASSDYWDVPPSTEASVNDHSCSMICTTKYEPVCGSDGATYTSVCAFSIAQCKTATLKLVAIGECAEGSNSASDELPNSDDAAESCPDACLEIYDPIIDESGKTYSNECFMRMAKCKDTNEVVDILTAFKRLYGRSFGASRNKSGSDDLENVIEFPTNSNDSTQSTKSSEASNSFSASDNDAGGLYESDSESGSGSSSSTTCAACPDLYSPVCGSDGTTYLSMCELELANCKNPKLKVVLTSEENCADTSPEQVVLDNASTSLDRATS